jgi:hypothetical protein
MTQKQRHPRPRLPRAALVTAAAAGISMLAAGCGGASTTGADTFLGGTYAQSVAYTKCMRSHGAPQWPAPDAQGNWNAAQINQLYQNVSQALRNASAACDSLLPNAGSGLSVTQIQDMQQQNLRNAVKAAQCMRAHGIGNFPDPAGSTQASGINWQPVVSAELAGGFSTSTPSYEAAFDTCSGKRVGGPIPPSFAPGASLTSPSPGPGSGPGVRVRPSSGPGSG